MSRRRKKHGIKWRSLYQWHRMLGIAAGVFVLLLAVTGLMINHTESLELDERYAKADWLLNWYGIAPPADAVSYRLGEHWVSQLGNRLYLDGEEIPGSYGRLLGVAGTRQLLVIAVEGDRVDGR